jgi:ATP-dependent DNA ligase
MASRDQVGRLPHAGAKAGDRVRLFNRRGQDCTHRYPRVAEAGAFIPAFSAILDCELVAVGKAREDFWRIRSAGAHLQLVCFDVMVLDGEDLGALPLLKRKAKPARASVSL